MPDRLKLISQTEEDAESLIIEAKKKAATFQDKLSKQKNKLHNISQEKLETAMKKLTEEHMNKSSDKISIFNKEASEQIVQLEKKAAATTKKAIDKIFKKLVEGPWP